jgi:hypothetical protein
VCGRGGGREVGVVVGVGVGAVKFAIMQHLSDCDGSAIYRISTITCSIWPIFYRNPMQFELFQTISKF